MPYPNVTVCLLRVFADCFWLVAWCAVREGRHPAEFSAQPAKSQQAQPFAFQQNAQHGTPPPGAPIEWNRRRDRLIGVVTGRPLGYHPFFMFQPSVWEASSPAITVQPFLAWHLAAMY